MLLNQFLFLGAFLFCTGVYGVLARKNAVLVLMSIELILNAVNVNLIAFGAFRNSPVGQVFALFVIIYRNRRSIDLTEVDLMKG
jgi:NADH:ubiquinone oxidoreductase subunit K